MQIRNCLQLNLLWLFLVGFIYVGNVYIIAEESSQDKTKPKIAYTVGISKNEPAVKCPLQGNDWKFIPEFSDEFNGNELDIKKWYPNNPTWLGREPGYFAKENVTVNNGKLQLTARAENRADIPKDKGFKDFTTAAVKSKERVLYGYFEVRSKPMNSKVSSSFWFYAQDPDLWTEIDVYEMSGKHPDHESVYHMNLHVFITPKDGKKHWNKGDNWKAPYRFVDDFHRYGLLWTKEVIEWYVDDQKVYSAPNTHWHQSLNINFDSETMPEWFGLPDPADLPSVYEIDYIRCWQKKATTSQDTPVSR